MKEVRADQEHLILELLMLEVVAEVDIMEAAALKALEEADVVMEVADLAVKHKVMQPFMVAAEDLVALKADKQITAVMDSVES
jgi:hypothetical protein